MPLMLNVEQDEDKEEEKDEDEDSTDEAWDDENAQVGTLHLIILFINNEEKSE